MKLSIIIYQFQLKTYFLGEKAKPIFIEFLCAMMGSRTPNSKRKSERETQSNIKQHENENAKKKSINYQNESHFSAQLLTSLERALQFNFTFCYSL
jgi:hypothetical protein